jgi:lycopene beta-cyclase
MVHIGTAGGQTKASSGYTFQFIQKQSAAITDQLIKTGKPFTRAVPKRFHFYDSVLLNILYHKNEMGKPVFTDLFRKNKPQQVLRFLDNESSLGDELKIISSLPTLPFLRAAMQQKFHF